MMKGLAAIVAAIVFAAGIFVAIEQPFHSFQQCIDQRGTYNPADYSKQTTKERQASLKSSVFRIQIKCSGDFLNAHDGILTGLATVLLTAITGILSAVAYAQFVTTRAQLRAYCLVEAARVENIVAGQIPRAVIKVTNSGQTPAREFRQWASMGFDKFPKNMSDPPDEGEDELISHPLAPGAYIQVPVSLVKPISQDQISAIQSGAYALYVMGKLTYTDVFGRKQFTEYCLFAGGPIDIMAGTMSSYKFGNSFT